MKAYSLHLAAIQKDLGQLVEAQESFFAENVSYAVSVEALPFQTSPGVSVSITAASSRAWSAIVTHAALPQIHCSISFGV
jgi:hypothetical protein